MIKFTDTMPIGRTRKTKEGYLVAKIRSARTGVQLYRADEIGDLAFAAGFKAGDVVRVNRPESEVFSKKAMQSLSHAPLTVDHPPVLVTKDNWADYSVGEVSNDVLRDGEALVVSVIAKDARGIDAIQSTHKQVSWGYQAKLRDAADKSIADFEMYDFEYNHISAVPAGRAGPEYGFDDAAPNWGASPLTVEDKKMTELKTVILGDKAVKVEASDADTVAAILADHKTAIDAKDAEIVALTKRANDAEAKVLSDADIAKLVDAKVKSDAARAKVLAILKDEAKVAAMSDEAISGALAVLGDADPADDSMRKVIGDASPMLDHDAKIKAAQAKFLNPELK